MDLKRSTLLGDKPISNQKKTESSYTIFKPPQFVKDSYPYFYYTEVWKDFKYWK